MNEMIKAISQAEREANEKKERAQQAAAEILSHAEKSAAEELKRAEEKGKRLRVETLSIAEKEGEEGYQRAIKSCQEEQKSLSDDALKDVENIIKEIVGRICSGS